MRSIAPAIASEPPLISASLVLVGKSTDLAGRRLQAGGAHLERAQRQAEARAGSGRRGSGRSLSRRVDRHRRADHDHQRRPRRAARERRGGARRSAPPSGRRRAGSDGRSRWSRRTAGAAHHPARLDVPDLELRLGAAADALAGDDAAEHARGRRQVAATRSRRGRRSPRGRSRRGRSGRRPGAGAAVERPLRRVLPDVDGEKAHASAAPGSGHLAGARLHVAAADALMTASGWRSSW